MLLGLATAVRDSPMPRQPRSCLPGYPHHVIQRGNNRQVCFTSDADIGMYSRWLAAGATKFGVAVHAWVFMTNHVHLLATPQHEDSISRLMQYLGRLYVRYFNRAYSRTGTLYEGRFRSNIVQADPYLLFCLRYIELNPVRAGMVTDPGDYRWSSYHAHAFGHETGLWTPHPSYIALGSDPATRQSEYRQLVSDAIDLEVVARIRHCANKGLVLGSEAFRGQIAKLRGQVP